MGLRYGMDLLTSNECVSCSATCVKKPVKSLCAKCYRTQYKSIKICIDCNESKKDVFVKDRCQKCRTIHNRSTNPNTYVKSRLKNKEKFAIYSKEYRKTHKKEKAAKEAKRRGLKLNATPKWSDLEQISNFYKNCPIDMEVDHIIPLKNDMVCGLHVSYNLQYLTKQENRVKHSKFDGSIENNGWRLNWQ